MTYKDDRFWLGASRSRRPFGAEMIEKFKCLILYLGNRFIECDGRVVSGGHDTSVWNVCGQKVSCFHVLYASPCNPWTDTTSIVFSPSFVASSNIPIFSFAADGRAGRIGIVSSTGAIWLLGACRRWGLFRFTFPKQLPSMGLRHLADWAMDLRLSSTNSCNGRLRRANQFPQCWDEQILVVAYISGLRSRARLRVG